MDVVKKKKKNIRLSSMNIFAMVLIGMLIILGVIAKMRSNRISIKRSEIIVGTIKHGDLEVISEGYGTLISNKKQQITATTTATVKEIILKPGARVVEGSVIVLLENPELIQKVENSQQELEQTKANLRQMSVNQQLDILGEKSELSKLRARYKIAKLKRAAEKKLVESGVIAQITYQESILNEELIGKQIELTKIRIKQLSSVHQEANNIQLERIKQQQGKLNIAQKKVDDLAVKAAFDGVLQQLSVEHGQSLSVGQGIALIGSVTDLVALIKVPQNQVQQIVIGQKAIIETRQDQIVGHVARIDPIVEKNTVNVEIYLPKELPASARPQLNVDGIIITDILKNVNYIELPANVKSGSVGVLYRLDNTLKSASLKEIRFGRRAGRYIEVISDVQENERYVLSDILGLTQFAESLIIES